MYDYYSYPQMFESPDNNQREFSEDEDEGFQHVTYVNNGAVITNPKTNHFGSTVKSNFADQQQPVVDHVVTEPSVNLAQEDQDALVFLNPILNGDEDAKFQSPVLDFDAKLSGMMGALAEIQKKGDSMLGSIR